jgi:hypothetical protein
LRCRQFAEIDLEDESMAWGLCDLGEARAANSFYITAASKAGQIVEKVKDGGGAP